MSSSEQYERVCKNDFAKIHAALDRLDTAIRGNGRPGIQARLSRLESAEATRSKLLWAITVAVVALAVGALWKLIFGA